jgi:CheY-like chemotaxis protein
MTARRVEVLHVEDDAFLRLVVSRFLACVEGFEFVVHCVASEEVAVDAFDRGRIGLVILDYYLDQGDGASCLRRIREVAPEVPILVISGAVDPEVAADLLRLGADQYLDKRDLNSRVFASSVRGLLGRADAWGRRRGRDHDAATALAPLLARICETYDRSLGGDFHRLLDEFAFSASRTGLTEVQLRRMFDDACESLAADPSADPEPPAVGRLHPILLEALYRVAHRAARAPLAEAPSPR